MKETYTQITCDEFESGCEEIYVCETPNVQMKEIRKLLRMNGWRRWRGLDLCPDCYDRLLAKGEE